MKKWLLRLLVALAVLVGMFILALNVISGTGEAQRRGLEQSFSQLLGGNASFGKLTAFNLFPDLTIAFEGMMVTGIHETGTLSAEKAEISFATTDILFRTRYIQKLNLTHVKFSAGSFVPKPLELMVAGLYPADEKGKGKFAFEGLYDDVSLKGEISTEITDDYKPRYVLADSNPFTINIGSVQLSGSYDPDEKLGGSFSKLSLFSVQKSGKQDCAVPPDKSWKGIEFLSSVLSKIADIKTPSDFKTVCEDLSSPSVPSGS